MEYTCVDGFCGAGGLSLGLQKSGMRIVLGFDMDPRCVETHRLNPRHLPFRCLQTGIEDMLGGGLLRECGLRAGELFLLAGGPPCQGFSIQRIGADLDVRNSLVMLYMELIVEVRPYYFLMENVPGIAGKRGKELLDAAIEFVSGKGYWVSLYRMDAQDYGVPQRRRRVFVVGERRDLGLSTFERPPPLTPAGRRRTVRACIGHLPPPPEDGSDHPSIRHHRRDRLSDTNLKRLAALEGGQGRHSLPEELLADCHKRDAGLIGHRYVYGRMAWDEVAPTITARFDSFTRGKFGHPDQLRTISLREGSLLQTFPKDFVFAGNKVEVARQIGNAVPPLLGQQLGREIIRCHEDKQKPSRA